MFCCIVFSWSSFAPPFAKATGRQESYGGSWTLAITWCERVGVDVFFGLTKSVGFRFLEGFRMGKQVAQPMVYRSAGLLGQKSSVIMLYKFQKCYVVLFDILSNSSYIYSHDFIKGLLDFLIFPIKMNRPNYRSKRFDLIV